MSNKSQSGLATASLRRVGRRDSAKEQYWREVLERQVTSGQSVRAFCAQEALALNSFYAWRRTIAERDGTAKRTQEPAAFVPAVICDPAPWGSWLVIELSCGRALRVPESIAAPRLAELVAALERRAAP